MSEESEIEAIKIDTDKSIVKSESILVANYDDFEIWGDDSY